VADPATESCGDGMHDTGRGRWLGLAMLSLGVAMIIVDATIVNVAIPSIIRDLKIDSTTAEWINTTYALVFAALLITLGRIGDVWGRRRLYLAGLGVFIAASMLAGVAPSGQMLIAARVLQGVGGAMILPATQSILNTNFQGRDRAIAFGIWGATIGGVAAVGPLLGGWLTTNLSWRWAFFINLPIGLLAIAGTLAYICESKDEESKRGFDLPGFVLVTLGLGGVVFALIEGRNYGWWVPNHPFAVLGWDWPLTGVSVTPFAIGLGLAGLVLFTAVETSRKRRGSFYLFDFSLWSYKGFRYGNLAGTIVSLGEFGLLFALPLFLQADLGYSAFRHRAGLHGPGGRGVLLRSAGSQFCPAIRESAGRHHRHASRSGRHHGHIAASLARFARLGPCSAAVHIRHRRWLRHVAADQPGPVRHSAGALRHCIRRELNAATGRFGARHRHSGNGLVLVVVERHADQPRSGSAEPVAGLPRDGRVAGRFLGRPDPDGNQEPGAIECRSSRLRRFTDPD
jgi:MFS family permease